MVHFIPRLRAGALVCVVFLVLAGPVFADLLFTAVLNGPTSGTTSPATGTATLILNSAQTEVNYVIDYFGLLSPELGSHIHHGAPGEVGPRFHTLLPGPHKTGTWAVGAFEVAELNAGRVYINIHTELNPTGEIRGNVEFASVAAEALSWGSVKALYK